MDRFISYEKIQQMIDEAGKLHDHELLQHVKLFLEYKLNSIENENIEKTTYNFESLYKAVEINSCKCNLPYEILKVALKAQKNEKQLIKLVQFLNDQFKPDSSHNLKQFETLKLLKVIFNVCRNESFNSVCNKYLYKNQMLSFFMSELQNSNSRPLLLANILPLYLSLETSQEYKLIYVESIMQHTTEMSDLETFAVLVDNIIKVCPDIYSRLLQTNPGFWNILENCISSRDVSSQKQATYILKTTIDFVLITSEENLENLNSQQAKECWNNYFILLNVSREKQLHLIKPCLNLLNNIKELNTIWQTCIFKILLNNFQNYVVSFTAKKLFSDYGNYIFSRDMIRHTLIVMNKNSLLKDTFLELNNFCLNLDKDKLQVLLEESLEISWNTVSMWYFIKSVFNKQTCPHVSFTILQRIVAKIKTLPHIFIRESCLNFIINLSNFFSFNFKNLLGMYGMFTRVQQKIIPATLLKKIGSNTDSINKELNKWNDFEKIDMKSVRSLLNIIIAQKDSDLNKLVSENLSKFCKPVVNIICAEYDDIITEESHSVVRKIMQEEIATFPNENIQINLPIFVKNSSCFSKYGLDSELHVFHSYIYEKSEQTFLKESMAFNVLYLNFYKTNEVPKKYFYCTVVSYIKTKFIQNFKIIPEEIAINFLKCYFDCCLFDDLTEIEQFFDLMFESENCDIILIMFEQISKFLNLIDKLKQSIDYYETFLNNCVDLLVKINKKTEFPNVLNTFLKQLFLLEFKDVQLNFYEKLTQKFQSNNFVLYLILNAIPKDFIPDLLPILLQSLFYGIIIHKIDRIEYSVCKEIFEEQLSEGQKANNPIVSRRLLFFTTLVKIAIASVSYNLEDEIINELLLKYKKMYGKRYFPDSQINYEKQRIIQILLVVPYSDSKSDELIDVLINSFCDEIHQPCIKQLSQWLLIRYLLKKPLKNAIELIMNKMKTGVCTHPSTVVAFIPILYHLTLDQDILDTVIKVLLPWSMGPNFKLRVYSQAALSRLYKKAEKNNYTYITNKYKFLQDCVQDVIRDSDTSFGETLKLDEVFFDVFLPNDHYSIPSIFFDLPKLNGVNPIEWEYFLHPAMICKDPPYLILNRKNHSLFNYVEEKFDAALKLSNKESCHLFNDTLLSDVQRKITTPWKTDLEESDTGNDLILVTSLIDKLANLGGLSRTCEVFGVQQLVMSNSKVVQEKEFKSLSMSSESLIKILEVKIDDLKEYFLKIKTKGYTLIGAEQTSNSTSLFNYEFPKKTVLVLGNEKEGIPANLIPLLDVCLEIPQFGQIRSLNVHVAGALFIGEYAKQHLINS